MLKIRFQRVGRKNDPAFRMVVTERRSKPKSGGVEIVGSYHPKTKHVVLKNDRILYWISQGATPSATVHNLLITKGVMKGKKMALGKTKVVREATDAVGPGGVGEVAVEANNAAPAE